MTQYKVIEVTVLPGKNKGVAETRTGVTTEFDNADDAYAYFGESKFKIKRLLIDNGIDQIWTHIN
jgi:hypothetical protein